jgi:hypothetical protein
MITNSFYTWMSAPSMTTQIISQPIFKGLRG